MNDFLKTMGQFGMEGLGYEPAEMTLEEEMNAEIAMEAELDEAYAQMDFANIVAGTSQAEAILTAMAEREVGLESNAGRDAAAIYGEFGLEGFGMEAVKDVVARKAYSGIASLKALINTCISWLKQLLGIHTASKKVFSGLKKKAQAMRKQLGKVQSKVSEKLKRDMPDYLTAMEKISKGYKDLLDEQKSDRKYVTKDGEVSFALSMTEETVNNFVSDIEATLSETKRASEDLDEVYDKTDSNDYEGSECFNHIVKAIRSIETTSNNLKGDDFAKMVDKNIKTLESARKEIDKDKKATPAPNLPRYFNKLIELYNKKSSLMKKSLKAYVKVADDALTMGKGIYASLV